MEIEWAATLGSQWLLFTPLRLLFHAARQREFCARNHSVYKTRLCTECTLRSVRLWHSGERTDQIYESLVFVIWACWKTRLGNVRHNTSFLFLRAAGDPSGDANGENRQLILICVLFSMSWARINTVNITGNDQGFSKTERWHNINLYVCLIHVFFCIVGLRFSVLSAFHLVAFVYFLFNFGGFLFLLSSSLPLRCTIFKWP